MAFGDTLSYLRGSASGVLSEPRDYEIFKDFLYESLPGLASLDAAYPFYGVPVRPFQSAITTQVPAPSFDARAVGFDGATYANNSSLSVDASGSRGLISLWLRNTETTWEQLRYIFETRNGSTQNFSLRTDSSNRIRLVIDQAGGGDGAILPPSNTFQVGEWYHVAYSWDHAFGRAQMFVNGSQIDTSGFSFAGTAFEYAQSNVTRMTVGATTTGGGAFTGDIGHLYLNCEESRDLSITANLEAFIKDGAPVDLGGNGERPTGTAPAFYMDGSAGDYSNKGTGGSLAITGTLTTTPDKPKL